jgi:hypothetical protein
MFTEVRGRRSRGFSDLEMQDRAQNRWQAYLPTPDGPASMNTSQHKTWGLLNKDAVRLCTSTRKTHIRTPVYARAPAAHSTGAKERDVRRMIRWISGLPRTSRTQYRDGSRRAALGRTGLYGWRATQGRHMEGPVCSTGGFYLLWTHYRPPMDPYRTVAKRSHRRS